MCWDHDYGGLALLDAENHYPWEDRLESRTENSIVQQYALANPYNMPEISRLLEISCLLVAPSDCPSSMSTEQGKDCFMLFPWEILESIAALLSTKDALILRLASRSFRPFSPVKVSGPQDSNPVTSEISSSKREIVVRVKIGGTFTDTLALLMHPQSCRAGGEFGA